MPDPTTTHFRSIKKSARACEYCRLKKIKCDANQPCNNCVVHNEECRTRPAARRGLKERHRHLQERAERAEALLAAAGIPAPDSQSKTHSNSATNDDTAHTASSLPYDGTGDGAHSRITSTGVTNLAIEVNRPIAPLRSSSSQLIGIVHESNDNALSNTEQSLQAIVPSTQTQSPPGPLNLSSIRMSPEYIRQTSDNGSRGNPRARSRLSDLSTTSSPVTVGGSTVEHHGPDSYLSICSDPGVEWVSDKIGNTYFGTSANALQTLVSRDLKLQRPIDRSRKADPDPETAWEFTRAYFVESLESQIAVVNRQEFQDQLERHLKFGTEPAEDWAWFVLRNVIFAFGCRICRYRQSSRSAWREAQEESWQYFEAALSVHTELLFCPSVSCGVTALLMMSLFVEGAGVPKLEYMLISNALRLAQSKGFHLRPAASERLSPEVAQRRAWIFWSIYNHEKHIAYVSGRPSIIDDDEITCELPKTAPNGTATHTVFFRHVVEHSKIASSIMKELSKVKMSRKSPEELLRSVDQLEERLESWYSNISPRLRLTLPLKKGDLAAGVRVEHVLQLYFAYKGSLIAINSTFGYPWNSTHLQTDSNTYLRHKMEVGTEIVAQASRDLILATRDINIDATAPTWLTFYYPLLGMINLFIHIIRFPNRQSVTSDIQLVDMVAAYFGHLEFSTTSQLTLPFTRDLAHWARAVYDKARSQPTAIQATKPTTSSMAMDLSSYGMNPPLRFEDFGVPDLGQPEDWVNFLPSMAQTPLMTWNEFHCDGRPTSRG